MSLKDWLEKFNLEYTLASFGASLVVHLLHPLDIIKTRLQSHDGKKVNNVVPHYRSITNSVKLIYREEGVKGFFKGFAWSFFAVSTSRMIFFTTYEKLKDKFEQDKNAVGNKEVQVSSLMAAVIGQTFTLPLWAIKTRMLLNTQSKISGMKNFIDSSSDIYREFGLRGYWRGFFVSLPLCLHAVIKMTCYEWLKSVLTYLNKNDPYQLNFMIAGFIAKVNAICITYPLVTVRTRVQQKQYILADGSVPKYQGNLDVIKKIFVNEGVRGFYKGINASILMNTPSIAIYFYFYEHLKQLIQKTKQMY